MKQTSPGTGTGSPSRPLYDNARLLMLVPGLVWAGNAIVARAVAGQIPPVGLAFWRWAIGALIVLPFAWPYLKRDLSALREHWLIVVVLSALGIAGFNASLYLAAEKTTAINILMLQTAVPVLIVAATYLIFGDRVNSRQAVGIALSLAGAVTLVSHGDTSVITSLDFNAGDLWMLAACLIYAIYTALFRLRPQVEPISLLFAISAIGAILLIPFYIVESAHGRPMPITVESVLAVGYVAIFASVLGYYAYNRTVELLGANTAGMSVYLVPVFGTVLAVVLLGERPQLYQFIGIALIAAGIVLATRRQA